MYQRFEKLPDAKRQAIRNAALSEFAEKGYEKASTDRIAQRAEISKGALFFYFQSKLGLYRYLFADAMDCVQERFVDRFDTSQPDLFQRLLQSGLLKIDIAKQEHPALFDFLSMAMKDEQGLLDDAMRGRIEHVKQVSMEKMLSGLDVSRFRAGIDPARAAGILLWVSEGFTRQMEKRNADKPVSEWDMHSMMDELTQYYSWIRQGFYKEEDDHASH